MKTETPAIKKGLIFTSKWFNGIVTVERLAAYRNAVIVTINKGSGQHSEEWDLKQTIWGFENGDYKQYTDRGKVVHHIKTDQEFFNEIWVGKKSFELRKNDRDYKIGDIVYLCEWSGVQYIGRAVKCVISSLLQNYPPLPPGYCIFSFVQTSRLVGYFEEDFKPEIFNV